VSGIPGYTPLFTCLKPADRADRADKAHGLPGAFSGHKKAR
jgi:hypothetical protein